jgi:hypothetical protein
MIILERVRVPLESMRHNDLFLVYIDLVHVAAEKIHASDHLPDRINDVRQIQIACRDLVQHRRKQKEILAIYDSDFESGVPTSLEFQRSVKTAKSAAENEHTRFVLCHVNSSFTQRNAYRNAPDLQRQKAQNSPQAWGNAPGTQNHRKGQC